MAASAFHYIGIYKGVLVFTLFNSIENLMAMKIGAESGITVAGLLLSIGSGLVIMHMIENKERGK